MVATCEKCRGPFPVADTAKMCPLFCPPCGRAYAADARAKLEAGDRAELAESAENDHCPEAISPESSVAIAEIADIARRGAIVEVGGRFHARSAWVSGARKSLGVFDTRAEAEAAIRRARGEL